MSFKSLIVISTALVLTGCATTQLTSGSNYLSGYKDTDRSYTSQIDQEVREIAAIEPQLSFPARIGLARIEGGSLTTIPHDEANSWADLVDELGYGYGEFIPVSPLIASMVDTGQTKDGPKYLSSKAVIDHIRRGSARQHLDHVLVYEVNNTPNKKSNALRVTDLTVLGLFIMPSRKVEIESTASAILIDVRNGYPYGTASGFAEKSTVATAAGANSRKVSLNEKARVLAVNNLTEDVATMIQKLRLQVGTTRTALR